MSITLSITLPGVGFTLSRLSRLSWDVGESTIERDNPTEIRMV